MNKPDQLITATTIIVWQNDTPKPYASVLALIVDHEGAWVTTGYHNAAHWQIVTETYGDGCERTLKDGERVAAWAYPSYPDPALFAEVSL